MVAKFSIKKALVIRGAMKSQHFMANGATIAFKKLLDTVGAIHKQTLLNFHKDTDLFLLANPVSSCLSLQIVLRVPVTVKDDHSVCCSQVDAQTSSTSRKQEAKIL